MDFLLGYADFLLRTLTVLVALIILLLTLAALRSRGRAAGGQLRVSRLNDFYQGLTDALQRELLDKAQLKALLKARSREEKQAKKQSKKRLFVLDFDGDIKASATDDLRHEVTAVLAVARADDEVVLRLESGGGVVHGYGLAAAQLARIRAAGIPLTVCVDKVAASGGYMMACIADRILAAPFAMLGSIGVVAQLPNLHRLLQKHSIDVELHTAGEFKRTLTVFGENTDKGREKFQNDLENIHGLFKVFVAQYRPQLEMARVATGEVWLGSAALEQQLVDELITSDQYLTSRSADCELLAVSYSQRKSLPERVGLAAGAASERALLGLWNRLNQQRFW